MKELIKNIFIGDDNDYYRLANKKEWGILHCAKHPFHCQFVGYSGNLPNTHKDYAYKRIENEMALNLVDLDFFSANYLDFNRNMFETAFKFLDEYYDNGKPILIHCNQGLSRSPSLAMLYMATKGIGCNDFATTLKEFKILYPNYQPKKNIFETIKALWNNFVKGE